jgi:hypothetical protein
VVDDVVEAGGERQDVATLERHGGAGVEKMDDVVCDGAMRCSRSISSWRRSAPSGQERIRSRNSAIESRMLAPARPKSSNSSRAAEGTAE